MFLDYYTFAKVIPLFAMSLIALILWKVFDTSKEKENISEWVYVVANIL